MYSGPVNIQVNGGRQGDPRLPFLINRGRVLLGPMLRHSEARGSLGVQKDRYIMDDGSYAEAIATPYVSIIAIHLVTGGGDEDERKKKRETIYPLSFMGMRPTVGGERGTFQGTPWHALSPVYSTDTTGVEPVETVSWRLFVGGQYDLYPCGNVTWFPQPPEGADHPAFILSWIGPYNRGFRVLDVIPQNVLASTNIWINRVNEQVPPIKFTTLHPVIGAWVTPATDLLYPLELRYLSIRGAANAYVAYCYAWRENTSTSQMEWVDVWELPLDNRVVGVNTSLLCNPAGTEGRVLLLEITSDTYKILANGEEWDASNLPAHIEAVFDLALGTVVYEHHDIDDYPYVEHDIQEEFDDSSELNDVKLYYVRTEIPVPAVGNEFTLRLAYNSSATALTSSPFRQTPYPGETYAFNAEPIVSPGEPADTKVEVTVVSVGFIDPLPEGAQETVHQEDIDLLTADVQAQVLDPASMSTPPYRGGYFARASDVVMQVTYKGVDASHAAVDTVVASKNRDGGRLWFKWNRLQRRTSGGRHIAAVDYAADGNPVKAFLVRGERKVHFVGVACGPGIEVPSDNGTLGNYMPPLPPWPWDPPPVDPIDWSMPQPVAAAGLSHNAYIYSVERIQAVYALEIEGGPHNGKRIFLTNYEAGADDFHEGTGYVTESTGDAAIGSTWAWYDRQAKLWDSRYDIVDKPLYGSIPEETKNMLAEVDVEYLDLRTMLIVTNALSECRARGYSTAGANVGSTTVAEPVNIPGAEGGIPSYTGFNRMAVCNDTANSDTNTIDRRVYDAKGVLHARDPFERLDPQTSEVIDADEDVALGLPYVKRIGIRGQRGSYAAASLVRSHTLCTASHSSQTRRFGETPAPHKKRRYSPNAQASAARVGHGANRIGTGAADPQGSVFASFLVGWKDFLPNGYPLEPGTSLTLIDGDPYDLTYMWDVERHVRFSIEEWAEQWGAPILPDQEALPENERDPEYNPFDHATEVWYGAKPIVVGPEEDDE